MTPTLLRILVVACFAALALLGLAWELWLAPLRPGAWLMSLKVIPLVAALPGLHAGRVKTFQWWSMVVMVYLTEGLVRGVSDTGPSVPLAWIETALAATAFLAILAFVRQARRTAAG